MTHDKGTRPDAGEEMPGTYVSWRTIEKLQAELAAARKDLEAQTARAEKYLVELHIAVTEPWNVAMAALQDIDHMAARGLDEAHVEDCKRTLRLIRKRIAYRPAVKSRALLAEKKEPI
jgi:hypothetical protein